MRKIHIPQNPFDEDEILYSKSDIEFEPGVTVLVGCNGSGKTTFLNLLKEQLDKDSSVAVLRYDNLHEGGQRAKDSAGFHDDFNLLSVLLTSSEGEQIVINLGQTSRKIGAFVKRHRDECSEIWVLLDALDSGLSIDNIVDIKNHLFSVMIKDFGNRDCDLYIIVSANSYEMASNERCLDISQGEYLTFGSYSDYKDFILESKKFKDDRYENN